MGTSIVTTILIMAAIAATVIGILAYRAIKRGPAAEREAARRVRESIRHDAEADLDRERGRSSEDALNRWRRNFGDDQP